MAGFYTVHINNYWDGPSPLCGQNGSICGDRGVSVPTPTALCAHDEGSLCPHIRLYMPTKKGLCARTYGCMCPHLRLSVPTKRGVFGIE
jgi:hypothetical protein